jgi:hypothetical protein
MLPANRGAEQTGNEAIDAIVVTATNGFVAKNFFIFQAQRL